ncbi:MAG: mannitol dehydrogenase family protein [Oscillospiraceae bacterium]|nr:mannitol dehydrogenase family protein [Oscillospiraceae bacterium]
MAILTRRDLADKQAWEAAKIKLPAFCPNALSEKTRRSPRWVHVGPGNIFRGYIAAIAQELAEKGKLDTGITALSVFDHQVIEKIYDPYDGLALQVVMHGGGKPEKNIIASVGEWLRTDTQWARAKEIFASPGLQMVSFTITEKGYAVTGQDGGLLPEVRRDIENSADIPVNSMAITAALLLHRFSRGGAPIALVSMDNFSHNGEKLKGSILSIARALEENGTAPKGFTKWLCDEGKVTFPWTMIDKITPRPDEGVAKVLAGDGFESTEIIVTDRNTYIAPFVNTEAPGYLVIEDNFPGGRPPLEDAGVYMVEKDVVDKVERMKVCTCLNPLHTAMSIFGCLLGYTSIAAEMQDSGIKALVERIGEVEGLPVVTDPGIFNPRDFLREVIDVRLPNPHIPDTPQRIATDTSQKLGIRFGETIKLYRETDGLDTADLIGIPLAIAAWCRYLLGIDDAGKPFDVSPDPLLGQLRGYIAGIELGSPDSIGDKLKKILSGTHIFGVDLYEDSLGERIEGYAAAMLAGPGAVRAVLERLTPGFRF